jgi:hypothetical protein
MATFRHLEAMRGQYLAFAFTITLASFAAAIPLIASIDDISGNILLLVAVFLLSYGLTLGSLYFSVRKIRIALGHYQQEIEEILSYFCHRARSDFHYDTARLNITNRTYAVLGWRLFRLQTTSESILAAFLAIGGAAEAICAARKPRRPPTATRQERG